MISRRLILVIAAFSFSIIRLSAQILFPLNHYFNQQLEKSIGNYGKYHSAIKPIVINKLEDEINVDSIILQEKYHNKKKYRYLKRKLFYEPAIIVDTTDFYMVIDPVFNFQFARDVNKTSNLTTNTRGIQVKGTIGDELYFQTAFYENQVYFPEYISNFIDDNNIAPGQGLVKPFKTGFDYAWSSGLLSYSPNRIFNIQFGHGKNIVGNGYRSLLLSDNAFNYPFLKITSTFSHFQYTNIFTSLIAIKNSGSNNFVHKYGTFHFLNFKNKVLEIGIFQSTIWQVRDSSKKNKYKVRYLNPVILYEPVIHSLNADDNSLIGLNFKLISFSGFHIYGQFLIDDIRFDKMQVAAGYYSNKTGYQAGIKKFNFANIENLFFQAEYNSIRPYTYSHKTPIQNYSHYNQPLAHPLGANFKEGIVIINYRHKNILFLIKSVYAIYGDDIAKISYGKDIYRTDTEAINEYGNKTTQGLRTNLLYLNPEVSYILNPNTNMQLSIGIVKRQLKNELRSNDLLLLYLAFRTSLNNVYYDF